ncbi:MAG TPA: alkaline phosphatase family protein [Candidatus Acidoferrales bacterium]|nr:alkaline phosphatase family protein [Candidatus Acidoferrales bacterium]
MKISLNLRVAVVLCAALSLAGCGSDGDPGNSDSPQHIRTVFLILMENKAWSEVKGSAKAPYINNVLLPAASYAENYKGPKDGNLHPSEPNYIWLEAGDNLGITTDDDPAQNHRPQTDHLVNLLEEHGISWRSYQEDISGSECPLTGVGNYKPKHNPMVFFDDVINYDTTAMAADPHAPRCLSHVRPFEELSTDLQNDTVARYNFLTPNQCNDMHSECAPTNDELKQGDDWLARWIPIIQASRAYKNGGAILITWDEAELARNCLGNCPIGMIALSPLAKGGGYHNAIAYDHSSTLKSMQEIFDVTPLLRHAGDDGVNDLSDLFTRFP